MSVITIRNVADLGPQFWLAAYCETCFHQADLDRNRLPPGTDLEELCRRLRCSQCGGQDVLLYRGWMPVVSG